MASIDGSWYNPDKVGICGIFRTKDNKNIFIFSGPCFVEGCLDAELEAILFVCDAWAMSANKENKLVICTDARSFIEEHKLLLVNKDCNSLFRILAYDRGNRIEEINLCYIP